MKKPFYEKKSAEILSLLLPAAGVLLMVGALFFRWYTMILRLDTVSKGGFTLWEVGKQSVRSLKVSFRKTDLIPPLLVLLTLFLVFYYIYIFILKKREVEIRFLDRFRTDFKVVSYVLPSLYLLLLGYLFMIRSYGKRFRLALERQRFFWFFLFYGIALIWMLLIALHPLYQKKNTWITKVLGRFRLVSRVAPAVLLLLDWQFVKHLPAYRSKMRDILDIKSSWQSSIERYKALGLGSRMKVTYFHGLGFWCFFLGIFLFLFGLCYKYVVDTLNEDGEDEASSLEKEKEPEQGPELSEE